MCMYHELHEASMNTDYFRIWKGIDRLVARNQLCWRAEYALTYVLSQTDETPSAGCGASSAYAQPLSRANYHLSRSVGEIEMANEAISHLFRGQLRRRTSGKLTRQSKILRELLARFKAVTAELNETSEPFKAKREVLDTLYRSCDDFINVIVSVRKSLIGDPHCADLADRLQQQEIKLRSLRARAGEWRDDPSRKVAENLRQFLAECQDVDRELKDIKLKALQSCLDLGLIVFNSRGRMLQASDSE